MSQLNPEHLVSLSEMSSLRKELRENDKTVVFTNGVFDIIHPGHVAYLKEAKALGDVLIVGLNSDSSARKLNKGATRPIQNQNARAEILGALKPVDYVVIFDEETPIDVIQALFPDVLVKGGDYEIDQIVGAREVMANGGEVKKLKFLEGYSTSAIEQKIKNEG